MGSTSCGRNNVYRLTFPKSEKEKSIIEKAHFILASRRPVAGDGLFAGCLPGGCTCRRCESMAADEEMAEEEAMEEEGKVS